MTYKIEILRSAAEACYWRDYRYDENHKDTMLDFLCDVEADDEIHDGPFADDEDPKPEWLRRFAIGYWQKKSGRYVYTIPKSDRLNKITVFVDQVGMLTPIALVDHRGDAQAGKKYALERGFDRFADQSLLAGALRGTFLAKTDQDNFIEYILWMIHMVRGEIYFRVRTIVVRFVRRENEDSLALRLRARKMRWDSYCVHDGFAATGTDFGAVFLLGNSQLEYSIDGYDFDNKGRRILGFHAHALNSPHEETAFYLCRHPDNINLSLEILRSVSSAERPT